MSDYQAPLRDMQFILSELAGLKEIAALPGCEEATTELVEAILGEAGKFAAWVLAPLNHTGDVQGCRLEAGRVISPEGWQDAYAKFQSAGWVGLSLSPRFGGQGLPKLVSTPVWEMWFSANLAFTMLPQLNVGESEAIMLAGSDELQTTFLPKLVSGQWSGTMNLTEPQAGSDLAAIRTRAEVQADGSYRIFGQKIFISYGEHDLTENIIHLVLARLPDAPPGVKGISMFLVPKWLVNPDGSRGARNDVRCTSIEHKLGIHGSPTCSMSYGDEGGAIAYLVGELNRGLEYMFVMMNEARFGVGVQGVALAERAYQQALAYAQERVQGRNALSGESGQPIIHHPDVKRMLLSMRARIMAGRGLLYTAAGWFDQARHHPDSALADKCRRYVDLLMPVAKGWCTELGNEVCNTAIQINGGMGFIEETGVAQFFRDARIMTIYEGTTGIQANDLIGRKILREGGATLTELLGEIRGAALRLSEYQDLSSIGLALLADVATVEHTLEWILDNGRTHLDQVLSGAVPFLHLLGTVCGAWQMARAALAAQARLEAGEGDTVYLQGIVALSKFYFGHIAPHAAAFARIVCAGGETVTAYEGAAF